MPRCVRDYLEFFMFRPRCKHLPREDNENLTINDTESPFSTNIKQFWIFVNITRHNVTYIMFYKDVRSYSDEETAQVFALVFIVITKLIPMQLLQVILK